MADKKISQLSAASTPLSGTEVLPIVQSGSTDKVSVANLLQNIQVNVSVGAAPSAWGGNTDKVIEFSNGAAVLGNLAVPALYSVSNLYGNSSGQWIYKTTNPATLLLQYDGDFYFQSAISGTAGTAASLATTLLVTKSGNTTFSYGNLIQGTAAKGINFTANTPAAGMTSQLLNWYEEGTWTPDCSSWTTPPTSIVAAYYTRVGNMVTVTVTGNGGACSLGERIGGLPFTVGGACGTATLRDFSGGTATSVGATKNGTTEIWNLSAASFVGLYWGMSATYIT